MVPVVDLFGISPASTASAPLATTIGTNGNPHISDISEGTNAADLDHYLHRKRSVDGFRGMAAFLLRNEEVQFQPAGDAAQGLPLPGPATGRKAFNALPSQAGFGNGPEG